MQETNQNNSSYFRHTHNGTDSPLLENSSITNALNAPQTALTTRNSNAISTGGAAVLSTTDSAVIDNMRTRINEIETKLQAMGLLS